MPAGFNNCVKKGVLKDACNNFQRQYIEMVLERVGGNQVKASQILGIHRNALSNKIKTLGIKTSQIPGRPYQSRKVCGLYEM